MHVFSCRLSHLRRLNSLLGLTLHKEVQGKAKGELVDKDKLTEVQVGHFLIQVKEALIQREITLDFGWMNTLKQSISDGDKPEVMNNVNIVKQDQSKSNNNGVIEELDPKIQVLHL